MKKSEIEKILEGLKESASYMRCNNTGQDYYRGEVHAEIRIYERLIKEGYQEDD